MDNLKKSLYSSVGIVCLPVALLPRPHFRIRKYSFSSFIQYFEHAIQLKILNYIEKVQHLAISLPFYTFFLCNNLVFSFFFVFFCSELNELRKPTTDNVEILRFFKYMRAARDGQDGRNCHSIYKKCSTITDSEQPAMLTTYNDINKLVHARKLVDE